ncbi:MAG: DUF2190 family protein [Mesorhizobium sp.]|uniref:DUF2190 family protein n=1 Tax=Mesorhizobium sp. TaxID=1871066 RepID=UPI000FEA8DE2|nr:DUF2190 family protein [Mesorhizobium sp.]RWB09018.1 MAG: DUF2190 family protein [Mesorhizobium sp.]RWB17439.1 MAG: DUF2190 family protein [Mesorhizobium sp.]
MKNYVQAGNVITATAPAGGVSSGDGILFDRLFGVASTDAAEGEDFELATVGVFDLPKAAGAVTFGAPLYWDDGAKLITTVASTTSGDNAVAGIAVAAAGSGVATARLRLVI